MQNKNFSGNPEEPTDVPGADQGNQKSFTLTILEKFATPVKKYPGIIVRVTNQSKPGRTKIKGIWKIAISKI